MAPFHATFHRPWRSAQHAQLTRDTAVSQLTGQSAVV